MSSATPGDENKLKEMIVAFYAVADESPPSQLKINDKVATVFAEMLYETEECSRKMTKVPLPPGRKATVVWLTSYVWGVFFDTFSKELNTVCVKSVIRNWKTAMHNASMGL